MLVLNFAQHRSFIRRESYFFGKRCIKIHNLGKWTSDPISRSVITLCFIGELVTTCLKTSCSIASMSSTTRTTWRTARNTVVSPWEAKMTTSFLTWLQMMMMKITRGGSLVGSPFIIKIEQEWKTVSVNWHASSYSLLEIQLKICLLTSTRLPHDSESRRGESMT